MQSSPGCPTATALPASSRSSTSVDEMGNPIEKLYADRFNGLIVAAGDVSVSPYASISGEPVTSFQRCATASCTAIPPPIFNISHETLTCPKPPLLRSALKD